MAETKTKKSETEAETVDVRAMIDRLVANAEIALQTYMSMTQEFGCGCAVLPGDSGRVQKIAMLRKTLDQPQDCAAGVIPEAGSVVEKK